MRKIKSLFFSLLLLGLFVGALLLTYKFVVPILIKHVVEYRLEKDLKQQVRIGRVDFNILKGIEFHRLLIYKPGEKAGILLQAREVRIDYLPGEILDDLRENGKNFKKWHLSLKVTSPEVIVGRFQLENLEIPLRLTSSRLITGDLKGGLYGGSLKGYFSFNLGSERKDYRFQGRLAQVDLSRLPIGATSPKKRLKGILAASVNLKGTAGGLKNLSGYGKISLVKGRIAEFPLLGGLMAFLHLPSLDKVAFREGKANFTISEGILDTEDLTLTSDQVKLLAEGKMDFQGNFRPSFIYKVSFSKGLLGKLPLIGSIISFVIDETGYLIAQVEVTGSLKKPKYRLIPLVQGLKNIFRIFKPSGK